jgi:hypothetical protein
MIRIGCCREKSIDRVMTPTVQQKERMAGMGMSEAAMKAARLQRVVVTTETPDFLITSPTWSWKRELS